MKTANKKILIARKAQLEAMRERLEEIKSDFEDIESDEQDVFDSRSEKWQDSERGKIVQGHLDQIAETVNSIDSAYGSVSESFDNMEALLEDISN